MKDEQGGMLIPPDIKDQIIQIIHSGGFTRKLYGQTITFRGEAGKPLMFEGDGWPVLKDDSMSDWPRLSRSIKEAEDFAAFNTIIDAVSLVPAEMIPFLPPPKATTIFTRADYEDRVRAFVDEMPDEEAALVYAYLKNSGKMDIVKAERLAQSTKVPEKSVILK